MCRRRKSKEIFLHSSLICWSVYIYLWSLLNDSWHRSSLEKWPIVTLHGNKNFLFFNAPMIGSTCCFIGTLSVAMFIFSFDTVIHIHNIYIWIFCVSIKPLLDVVSKKTEIFRLNLPCVESFVDSSKGGGGGGGKRCWLANAARAAFAANCSL